MAFIKDFLDYMEKKNINANWKRHYSLATSTSKSMIPAAVTPSSLWNCLIVLGWLTTSSLQHMSMNNTLHLIITSERETFVKNPSQSRLFSDHNVVLYDVVYTKLPKPPKETRYRKYKAIDTDSFGQYLAESIACLNFDSMSPNECASAYNTTI